MSPAAECDCQKFACQTEFINSVDTSDHDTVSLTLAALNHLNTDHHDLYMSLLYANLDISPKRKTGDRLFPNFTKDSNGIIRLGPMTIYSETPDGFLGKII